MTADGGHSTGTGVASPGHPDQEARPARRVSRFWWVLPYCAGALAVFVVAGLVIGLNYNSRPGKPAPTARASAVAAEPMPAEMFPDALFSQLTADIQARNETAFLGLASAAARPAISAWWANLRAIGFTTGAVIPTADVDGVHIDSHGDGSAVVLAGAHSPLDPDDLNGKPYVPMAHYRIGLHFSAPGATGQITSWQPLDDAPWDGGPLYVRQAAYVTVAGPAADSALVNQILPVAETAASYDIRFVQGVEPAELEHQKGFVLFVSGSAAAEDRWFAPDPQPQGWPPEFLGAHAFQLPGPATTSDYPVGAGQNTLLNAVSDNSMGGIRVVLTPTEPATGTVLHAEALTLVRVFALDLLGTHAEALAYGYPLKSVPSWPQEGFAVLVQAQYESNPDPTHYSVSVLTTELHRLPKSYRRGVYPSTAQLFGPSLTTDQDWGYVAASTYEYIGTTFSVGQMVVSATSLYYALPTPFGNVYKKFTSDNKIIFFGIHSIRLGWQPWLASL